MDDMCTRYVNANINNKVFDKRIIENKVLLSMLDAKDLQ